MDGARRRSRPLTISREGRAASRTPGRCNATGPYRTGANGSSGHEVNRLALRRDVDFGLLASARATKADLVPATRPSSWRAGLHTFASLMIGAGVNAKALSTYMGHASITITLDRYGHLMPDSEGEAAGLLDAYLGAANA